MFECNVTSRIRSTSNFAQFCVVDDTDGNLFGYKTSTDLGLMYIVHSVLESKVGSIVEEYKNWFVGLGKMKDKTAKLVKVQDHLLEVSQINISRSWPS